MALPHGVRYLQNWLTSIVINAVHYHYQWEQQNQLIKPLSMERT